MRQAEAPVRNLQGRHHIIGQFFTDRSEKVSSRLLVKVDHYQAHAAAEHRCNHQNAGDQQHDHGVDACTARDAAGAEADAAVVGRLPLLVFDRPQSQCDHGRDQDHQVEQEEQHHRGLQHRGVAGHRRRGFLEAAVGLHEEAHLIQEGFLGCVDGRHRLLDRLTQICDVGTTELVVDLGAKLGHTLSGAASEDVQCLGQDISKWLADNALVVKRVAAAVFGFDVVCIAHHRLQGTHGSHDEVHSFLDVLRLIDDAAELVQEAGTRIQHAGQVLKRLVGR
mmetsp:Transcript_92550/g.220277  ORF Transcript_92550/g.220277 Transcript_92550/m.220277 type:complete len:279 (-) Transcript_92550:667-1503(-)